MSALASVHVYTEDVEKIKSLVCDKYNVMNISKGWVSIFGDMEFFYNAEDTADELSKMLNTAVLGFIYHDDIMHLALHKEGKTKAYCYMGYEEKNDIKNAAMFLEEFDFEENQLLILRRIFSEKVWTGAVYMLEDFFGVALIICNKCIEEGVGEFIRVRK